jgi:hypothetical protein
LINDSCRRTVTDCIALATGKDERRHKKGDKNIFHTTPFGAMTTKKGKVLHARHQPALKSQMNENKNAKER